MQVLSLSMWSRFQGKKLKKIFVWAFALIMFGASCFAVLKAMNILAAESGWTITADGSGLLNVLKAKNDNTGVERAAYCLDPYTDFTTTYPDYVDSEIDEVAHNEEVRALLRRAYPVLTAKQMGIAYLNDASLTDAEAYEATQIAIWETVTDGEYEVNEVLVGRTFELVKVLLESEIVINEGPWLTVDSSKAVRANTSSTRDSYGPITFAVNTGSPNLDAAIKMENLTLSPVAAERSWTISTNNSTTGSPASSFRVGTSYYINYLKTAAGTMNFSLSNELADSKSLSNMEEIVSMYGAEVNQILGVVEDEPKVASASLEIDGNLSLKINKTWMCSNDCSKYYGKEIAFDVYENTANGYVLVGTATTELTSSMSTNTALAVANSIQLKSYTEYIVIERVLVPANISDGDIIPSVAMPTGNGTSGKYKVENGVPSVAGSGEAYYVGMRFVSGVKSGAETVNFTNKLTNLNVTLRNSTYVSSYFSSWGLLPEEINYYIYESTNGGSSWSLTEGPIKMYDFDSGYAGDYVLSMTSGTRYRVVQDVESFYDNYVQYYNECSYYYNYMRSSFSGSNYSGLNNVRSKGFDGYSSTLSEEDDWSFSSGYMYSNYAGIEWTAGWSDGATVLTIENDYSYDGMYYDSEACPEEPSTYGWGRSASAGTTTAGDNPNGAWASSYKVDWEVSGDYSDSGSQGGVSPQSAPRRLSSSAAYVSAAAAPINFFDESGQVYGYEWEVSFPSVTYTVTEDPASFCGGKSQTTNVSSVVIGGITKTTTTTATSEIAVSASGDGYSSRSYQYAQANCETGEITGGWSTSKPSSGGYAARAVVSVSYGTQYSDITVLFTNSYRTSTSVKYSTTTSPGEGGQEVEKGVALILKYGYDGVNTVAQYLDGTQFAIYDTDDEHIQDWTLSASDRGIYNSVSGTSNYYVSPLLPVGEYYLKEIAAVEGYIADTESKYFFTVPELDNVANLSITQVLKNGVSEGTSNFQKAIKNTPDYELAVFKFRRKVLASAIEESHIQLFRKTDTTEEPAYGNENLRGYEKVAEFESLVDGIVIEELVYGWYKLVEILPPSGYIGPEPEIAVGFSTYIGPTTSSENNYSGARIYIANDWVGIKEPPVEPDPEEEVPEVPKTGVMGKTKMNGGMVAATFLGMGSALVIGIALFVGKKLTNEIEEDGTIKLQR